MVTQKLFELMQTQFAHDDPQEVAVKEALTKVAFYLKGDFNVVAPKFLEILIIDANLDIDIKQENADLPTLQANTSSSFELKPIPNFPESEDAVPTPIIFPVDPKKVLFTQTDTVNTCLLLVLDIDFDKLLILASSVKP